MLKSPQAKSTEATAGLLYGLAAYLWWGLVPLYFDLVSHVQPLAVLAHRIVWSVILLVLIVVIQRRWDEVRRVLQQRRMLMMLGVCSLLIGCNWFVFIYAVSVGQVLQASLGYYINPLVSVLLAMVFLSERLRAGQWVGVLLALVGVAYLTLQGEAFPWISLLLACSFGLYGLVRKLIQVGPVIGLLVETAFLLPPAVVLLMTPLGDWAGMTIGTYGLLSLAGVITTMPLLWFAASVRRLRLSTVGFLQYVSPSCQFVVAVTLLNEHLSREQIVTFACIWTALLIYSIDSWRGRRPPQPVVEMAE